MTAELALAATEAEGLPLVRSKNESGFKGVYCRHDRKRPYDLVIGRKHHGCFATAEEAALSYVRHVGKEAAEAEVAAGEHMMAEEALAAAEAEGLRLVRSNNASGFKHVRHEGHTFRPYRLCPEGRNLGFYATAEEAALSYSRHIGKEAAEAESKSRAQKTAEAAAEKAADRAAEKAAKAAAKAAATEAAKAAAKEARARAKAEAAAVAHEFKRQQAAREELMAQRQRAMLQEAAERQKQRRGVGSGGAAAPRAAAAPAAARAAAAAATRAAEPGEVPTAALVEQVLRDRAVAHRCLGVEPFAPREAARKRYLALALHLHPDKVAHPRAAEAFAAVEAAFRALCSG